MTDIRSILSKNLLDLRRSRGWTQAEMAERSGFQSVSYSRWETGKSWPEPDTIAALAKALNVPESRLFQESSNDISPREALKALSDLIDKLNLN